MLTQDQTTTPEPAIEERAVALRDLAMLAGAPGSVDAFARDAARCTATHFGSPAASIAIRINAQDTDHTFTRDAENDQAAWAARLRDLVLEVQSEPRAIGQVYQVASERIAVIAAPIPGEFTGAIATLVKCDENTILENTLHELRAIAATIAAGLAARSRNPKASSLPSDKAAATIAKAGSYTSIEEFAFALTNNLRNKIGAESVAFAIPSSSRFRIVSISGIDEVKPRSPGTIAMRQAIEEAADQGRTLCAQPDDQWADNRLSTGHALHRAWSASAAGSAVVSIPLFAADELTAVVAITRRADRPFTREELTSAEELLASFGPAVPMVRRATRPLYRHAFDIVRDTADAAIKPGAWGTKAIAAAATLFAIWFLFGTTTYRVSARAVVKPVESVQLSAPFDAAIAAVFVKAGDLVSKDQPLAILDTKDLTLERSQLLAETRALAVEIDRALAESDVSTATLASARRDASVARLETVDARIAAATIRAPQDGIVMEGSPSERIGQRLPMGEPIFSFVPQNALRIDVLAPEHAAEDVLQTLPGRFAPEARPESTIAFTIDRIEPSTRIEDGRNVVAARASLNDQAHPEWLRPGMQGTARVDVGERPVWWVALHRVTDAYHARFMP